MERIWRVESPYEAQLLVDQLQNAGIEARILNQVLHGALGAIPMAPIVEVWILDRARLSEAVQIVEDYERRRALQEDRWIGCAACGEANPANFEVCWSCGEALVEQPWSGYRTE